MLLDEYLDKNNSSRYQLAKLSGLSQSSLQRYNEKDLRDCPIKLLDALGMLLGKKSCEVLREMREMEVVDELIPDSN